MAFLSCLHALVRRIVLSTAMLAMARVALTLPYWWSGFAKLLHPHAALAEIAGLGIAAPLPALIVLIIVQVLGSALIVFNRLAWLGAALLAGFTALVTLLAHPFWTFDGAARAAEANTFLEHIALIAGFVFATVVAESPHHGRSTLSPSR